MAINFLYCIDYPAISDKIEKSNRIMGWLICSYYITEIKIPGFFNNKKVFNYGSSRPDVAESYKGFPNNDHCGFTIITNKKPIDLKKKITLKVTVDTPSGKSKKVKIQLDLKTFSIQNVEIEYKKTISESGYDKIEKKFANTLKKHPWLTIRMDITNKCNLKCIMCHYKEQEIYSKPTKAITAEELKHNLKDIGLYVKHIMLSCGFEPLMSKHFTDILSMLNENFPHMEIALCTNATLLDSKARKAIIENNVTHVILSLDGVTKKTVERIRAGADFGKIIGNILALRDIKIKNGRKFPVLFMDFVLMNSNIHEAPAFVKLCDNLGIEIIDFRHLVGNIYFKEHEEMLNNNKAKYNYFRRLIIEESKKYNINVRLPEPFETNEIYQPESLPEVDLADFTGISPDLQTEDITDLKEIYYNSDNDADFKFLSNASCLRPFNEIMIVNQVKILPCSYYNDSMGNIDEKNTLHEIFFNEKYQNVRKKKMLSMPDHNCINCPIRSNLLPTEIVK